LPQRFPSDSWETGQAGCCACSAFNSSIRRNVSSKKPGLNQVANQQISQVTFMVRIAFDESAKAESSSYSTINRRIWRVLPGRQVDGIEESVLLGSQTVVRSPEIEIRLLFQRVESQGFGRRRKVGHDGRGHARAYLCNQVWSGHLSSGRDFRLEATELFYESAQSDLRRLRKTYPCSICRKMS
jgi:hypothetical protein